MTELTPTERAVRVTLALALGRAVTPAEVARETNCDLSNAYRLLWRISRVAPLVESGGRWALGVNVEGPGE